MNINLYSENNDNDSCMFNWQHRYQIIDEIYFVKMTIYCCKLYSDLQVCRMEEKYLIHIQVFVVGYEKVLGYFMYLKQLQRKYHFKEF